MKRRTLKQTAIVESKHPLFVSKAPKKYIKRHLKISHPFRGEIHFRAVNYEAQKAKAAKNPFEQSLHILDESSIKPPLTAREVAEEIMKQLPGDFLQVRTEIGRAVKLEEPGKAIATEEETDEPAEEPETHPLRSRKSEVMAKFREVATPYTKVKLESLESPSKTIHDVTSLAQESRPTEGGGMGASRVEILKGMSEEEKRRHSTGVGETQVLVTPKKQKKTPGTATKSPEASTSLISTKEIADRKELQELIATKYSELTHTQKNKLERLKKKYGVK